MTSIIIAFRNLLQARRRSFLLGFAIAIVASLFLLLRTASLTISQRMIESATTLSTGHVNVAGFFKQRRKGSDPIVIGRERLMADIREILPNAQSIIDRHRGWGRLIGPQSSINTGVNGIVYQDEAKFFAQLKLAAEKDFVEGGGEVVKGDFSALAQANTVLLFAAQAKKLGVQVGDRVTLVTEASGGQSNTGDLTVVAIAEDLGLMSNFNIYTSRQTILDLYRISSDTTGAVMVYMQSPSQSLATMEILRDKLAAKGYVIMDHDPKPFWQKFDKVAGEDWLGQRLDLTLWSDEISYVVWITRALDVVAFVVIFVLAIIIIGGITNAMWMSVRERTKEIGTMRAIGTQRWFIVRIFMLEAAFLGIFSGIAGSLFTVLLLLVINGLQIPISDHGMRFFLMANKLIFTIDPWQIFSTIVVFGFLTGIGAIYPALKAALLKPVDALMQSK